MLPLRYYASNDRSRGWREASTRAGNGAADQQKAEHTSAKRARSNRPLIRWIMAEFDVSRAKAVAMLKQEKRVHAAQRMRGALPAEALDKSAARMERKATKAINDAAAQIERIARHLED
jgi:hypothetical protein